MPYLEIEVSTTSFLALQLNKLRSARFCTPAAQAVGPFTVLIDHVEFGQNAIRHTSPTQHSVQFRDWGQDLSDTVDGLEVQLAQPITVVLVDRGSVLASPNAPAAPLLTLTATAIFRIDYFAAADSQCFALIELDGLEHAPLPPLPAGLDEKTLWKQFEALVKTIIPQSLIPVDPAAQLFRDKDVVPTGRTAATVLNAGITVDATGARLILRQELGGAGP